MSYQKHLGEGVILSIVERGENDRVIKILTRFGIKILLAKGVRSLPSKMRNGIDTLLWVEYEYVEGKEVERLVGIFVKAKLVEWKTLQDAREMLEARHSISNVSNFVLNTVVGETENDLLYESFLEGLRMIQGVNCTEFDLGGGKSFNIDLNKYKILETIWLVKILVSLGYWEKGAQDQFTKENYRYVLENQKILMKKINQVINNLHL